MRTVLGAGEVPAAAKPDAAQSLRSADEAARKGRLNEALELYNACLGADSRSLDACLGAAGVLVDLWRLDEAVAAYDRACGLAPAVGPIHSALLFHQHYLLPVDAKHLFEMHRRYGALVAPAPQAAVEAERRDPARRLRVGYVSPNLSRHSVGYFVAPLLRCHDRREFEIFCYYNHALSDDATQRMRAMTDGWRDIADKDDKAVAHLVQEDAIDVLVDLAGHSKGNRLGVFSRRPAPVQMTWLGYPDTTGLGAVDARLTDESADPRPAAEERHSERLARIQNCFLCYEPPADAPSIRQRADGAPIVFASFNNLAKINAPTLAVWGRILAAVPDSRLVLKSAPLNFPDTVDRVSDVLESCGIDPARVELRGWTSGREQHLDGYGEVDIALDTFPYNGTTTTCEALWMGVPVVTLAGEVHMSRVGASLLTCTGLGELIAHDETGYVRIATELARDGRRRQALRADLRSRLLASPLLDHAGFTHKLETLYREAWRNYCARR